MSFRTSISDVFQGQAFLRPLFYSYPGGLRFELSTGGTNVTMFLEAMRKAREICEAIFKDSSTITVTLAVYGFGSRFRYRSSLRALRKAGLPRTRERELWAEADGEGDDLVRVHLAFDVGKDYLDNLLWCAFAGDLGIEPAPRCTLYLTNLKEKVLVLPYDDRGMDVVGPAHDRLARLYQQFHPYLLEYDLEAMKATFEPER